MDFHGTSVRESTGRAAGFAIASAVLSFFATFSGHVIIGFVLGILAIPLGAVGALMATSPRVSGGILSMVAVFLGLVGIVFAVLGMVGKLF